jgi:O-antigen/teichoic acid export membrane protein
MLVLFVAVAQVFADCGLSASLIQRKTLTADDETSVWFLNIAAGLVLAGLLCALSPFVAQFYGQAVLAPMLCVQSFSIVISSFCIVQASMLVRQMQFKPAAMIVTGSTIASGLIAVAMACTGWGTWSLVAGGLSAALVRLILYWIMSDWRPRGRVRLDSIRSMWNFSSYLLYCQLIGIASQNLYAAVIGKVYSAESLGYYDRANTWRMLPTTLMAGIVNRVAFPLFSRSQDDKTMLLRRMRGILRGTLLVSAGGLTLLTVLADPLVTLLLTEKWRPSVRLLRILCCAGVFYPISSIYLMALQAQGHSHLNFRLETIKLVNLVIALTLVYRHGVEALAWSLVALSLIAYFLNAWYNVKLLGYGWDMQARDTLPSLCLCGFAGLSACAVELFAFSSAICVVGLKSVVFFLVITTGLVVFRKTVFRDPWEHSTWIIDRLTRTAMPSPTTGSRWAFTCFRKDS